MGFNSGFKGLKTAIEAYFDAPEKNEG